jgi:general secretion pathway protein L
MAMLVILLPARPRADAPAPGVAAELGWALSPDGLQITRQGRSVPARLPPADTVVAVLPPTDLAWHRITCPKAPAGRLRAALGGLLEEQLLDDDESTHLAVSPGAVAGQSCWVAAAHKPWLRAQLAALAAARRPVDRLVPALAPGGAAQAHFFAPGDHATQADGSGAWLAMADVEHAVCLPLAGSHAQALLARWRNVGASFHTTPAAASLAERVLGTAVPIRSDLEQGLAAARGPWQLLQFDLAPSRRGTRALGSLLRRLRTPAWRPVRWGLAVLSLVQLLGLNAYAWQLQRGLDDRREAMVALLKTTHPQVRSVLDAPVQMRRETELLRAVAGVAGDNDFDTLLVVLAQAWPEGQAPASQLRFDAGRLSFPASAWAPPQVAQFSSRLQTAGWSVEQAEGRLTVQAANRAARR